MNASRDRIDTPAPRAATPVHPTHRFKLLLQREFWEHKGGFFWAPLIAGGISLLLTLMMIIGGLVAVHRAIASGDLQMETFNINGMDLGQLIGQMSADEAVEFGQGINLTLFLSSLWPFIVLGFVVFFYCLGALYDERKDRSVLFWKSLPVSDTQTVLSKVVTATIVGPLLAVAASVVTMFGFMIMISIVAAIYGGNPWTLIWSPGNPLRVIAFNLAWIPVYALWSLPTVGWLMLCSSWARTKPFLWALMVPIFAGIFVSWFRLMNLFDLGAGWFWQHVVGRVLLGTVPSMDLLYRSINDGEIKGFDNLDAFLRDVSPLNQLTSLASPALWIGAVIGAAMIVAAIELRRRRELAD
ncbi:MAG: hypothetical protein ACREO8_00230 [Luteimonas sp.]